MSLKRIAALALVISLLAAGLAWRTAKMRETRTAGAEGRLEDIAQFEQPLAWQLRFEADKKSKKLSVTERARLVYDSTRRYGELTFLEVSDQDLDAISRWVQIVGIEKKALPLSIAFYCKGIAPGDALVVRVFEVDQSRIIERKLQ